MKTFQKNRPNTSTMDIYIENTRHISGRMLIEKLGVSNLARSIAFKKTDATVQRYYIFAQEHNK